MPFLPFSPVFPVIYQRSGKLPRKAAAENYKCSFPEPPPAWGYWSRRIDDTNRLVYRMVDGQVEVYQCKGHYDD